MLQKLFPMTRALHFGSALFVCGAIQASAHTGDHDLDQPVDASPILVAQAGSNGGHKPAGVTGEGDWKFRLAPEYKLPEAAQAKVKGAHSGFAVDDRTHNLYFGLKGVGVIRFGPEPGDSEILDGYPFLKEGNLHNLTLFYHDEQAYLVVPDNERGKVFVLDLATRKTVTINRPNVNDYYQKNGAFNPTDTEYKERLYVTDGYSPGNFILEADPFKGAWMDEHWGGKGTEHGKFETAHGITYNPDEKSLDISDRPRSRIERYDLHGKYLGTMATPEGSWPVDVEYWNGYAVVGCLFGPGKTIPSPVYIMDRDGKVVSTLKPKEDLGLQNADHIHDASWWIIPSKQAGGKPRVCVAVTPWNPGDFFILERVP